MPNYAYACLNCDKEQDRIVSIDDRDKQHCEECGNRLNRVWAFEGAVWSPTANGGLS